MSRVGDKGRFGSSAAQLGAQFRGGGCCEHSAQAHGTVVQRKRGHAQPVQGPGRRVNPAAGGGLPSGVHGAALQLPIRLDGVEQQGVATAGLHGKHLELARSKARGRGAGSWMPVQKCRGRRRPGLAASSWRTQVQARTQWRRTEHPWPCSRRPGHRGPVVATGLLPAARAQIASRSSACGGCAPALTLISLPVPQPTPQDPSPLPVPQPTLKAPAHRSRPQLTLRAHSLNSGPLLAGMLGKPAGNGEGGTQTSTGCQLGGC